MKNILIKEYNDALKQYEVALNQENNCFPEYIDLAIERVNIAKNQLDLVIAKLHKFASDTHPLTTLQELTST